MFVLNQEANLMYNLGSQTIEVSECTLWISYGNLEVRRTAWEGWPNTAVLKKLWYTFKSKFAVREQWSGVSKCLWKVSPFLVAWTLWFYISIKWGLVSEAQAAVLELKWWCSAFGLKEREDFLVQKEQHSIYLKGSKTRQETEPIFNEQTKKNKAKPFKFLNHSWEFGALLHRRVKLGLANPVNGCWCSLGLSCSAGREEVKQARGAAL